MSVSTPDYNRKWYVMAAIGIGLLLSTIDGSIVNIAMPTLAESFSSSIAGVQWVTTAYLLTNATLLLSIGRLGDMIGKKRIYVSGFVVFTLDALPI